MTDKINPGNCRRCLNAIHIKENYCRLTEWKKGEQIGEGWYHVHCFREGMHGSTDEKNLKSQAQNLIERTSLILKKMEGKI